jgi:hypothetical protein
MFGAPQTHQDADLGWWNTAQGKDDLVGVAPVPAPPRGAPLSRTGVAEEVQATANMTHPYGHRHERAL